MLGSRSLYNCRAEGTVRRRRCARNRKKRNCWNPRTPKGWLAIGPRSIFLERGGGSSSTSVSRYSRATTGTIITSSSNREPTLLHNDFQFLLSDKPSKTDDLFSQTVFWNAIKFRRRCATTVDFGPLQITFQFIV